MMHNLAIFGGTFDPIHNGHLHCSKTLSDYFHFNAYYFLPCKSPVHKGTTSVSNQQRIEMLQLALKPYPEFSIDLREMNRSTPSYMVDTLKSIRSEHPCSSISLIIGYDAFLNLEQWYQWQNLLQLAHLIVINRHLEAYQPPSPGLRKLLKQHQALNHADLKNSTSGLIYQFDAGDYPISSTALRHALKTNKDVSRELPQEVYQYINSLGLYQ